MSNRARAIKARKYFLNSDSQGGFCPKS